MRVPAAVGLKTIAAEQLLAAARLVVHVLDAMEKSPALVPAIATLLMVMVDAVEFERVADCEAVLEPMFVEAKARLEGLTVMFVDPAPVPVRATDCGLPVALSVN